MEITATACRDRGALVQLGTSNRAVFYKNGLKVSFRYLVVIE